MLFLCAIAIWLMFFSLRYPLAAAESARRALLLCAGSLIPSLFVFAVAAKLLVGAGVVSFFRLKKLGQVFHISSAGMASVFLGLFTGFPVGASVLASLVLRGELDREEASALMPFCNGAGASFVVGTVGGVFFGSVRLGVLLLISQMAATLFWLVLTKRKRSFTHVAAFSHAENTLSFLSVFARAVGEGAAAMLSVSGFVVFFSVFSSSLFVILGERSSVLSALFASFLEMSGGISALSQLVMLPLSVRVGLAGFFLGFGGFSVMMQVADRADAAQISMKYYFSGKFFIGVICGVISFLGAFFI